MGLESAHLLVSKSQPSSRLKLVKMVKNGQNLPQKCRPLKGNFQGLAVVEFQISGDFGKVQRTLFQQYLNESSSISLLQGENSPPKKAPPKNHQNFKQNFSVVVLVCP